MLKNKNILILVALILGIVITLALKNKVEVSDQGEKSPEVKSTGSSLPAKSEGQDLRENGRDHPVPKLVDLGADKCIPCKKMAPILAELKTEFAGKFDVEFIDVWKDPDRGKTYSLRVIPTQIFYSPDGKELFRHEGFFGREDILAKWKELGFDVTKGVS